MFTPYKEKIPETMGRREMTDEKYVNTAIYE